MKALRSSGITSRMTREELIAEVKHLKRSVLSMGRISSRLNVELLEARGSALLEKAFNLKKQARSSLLEELPPLCFDLAVALTALKATRTSANGLIAEEVDRALEAFDSWLIGMT